MKKNNKKIIIVSAVVTIVIIFCTFAVVVYSMMSNPYSKRELIDINNEKALNEFFGTDEEYTILAKCEYEDYVMFLYPDPNDSDVFGNSVFVKNKRYKDLYSISSQGYSSYNNDAIGCKRIDDGKTTNSIWFIYDVPLYPICSVFEVDSKLQKIKKLDEFEVPKNGFIVVKEYKLENRQNRIMAYNEIYD